MFPGPVTPATAAVTRTAPKTSRLTAVILKAPPQTRAIAAAVTATALRPPHRPLLQTAQTREVAVTLTKGHPRRRKRRNRRETC
jgi:hypothetical protein